MNRKTSLFYAIAGLCCLNSAFAATQLGSGLYYDESQITKLAQQYPARVSKDAGYPLIDNYSSIKSSFRGSQYNLNGKPIISGMWWTPLLAVDKPAAEMKDSDYLSPMMLIQHPLMVRLNEQGFSFGIPMQTPLVDDVHMDRGYENVLDVTVSTNDLAGTAPLVADYSDWMVKARWARNNDSLLAVNIVEGSPFVFLDKSKSQSTYLTFNNSQDAVLIAQANGMSLFKTKNATPGSDYRYYAVFTNPAQGTIAWKNKEGASIVPTSQGGSGKVVPSEQISLADKSRYMSVATIPSKTDSDAINLANQMKNYAYTNIIETKISYQYDQASAVLKTNFNYRTEQMYPNNVLSTKALTMLLPWQIDNMDQATKANCLIKDNCASKNNIVATLKGDMHLFVIPTNAANQSVFSTQIAYNGILPVLPNTLGNNDLTKIKTYNFINQPDPHLDASNPWTDTYATGKLFSRNAQLIKIANQLVKTDASYEQTKNTLLKDLKAQMTSFLTGLNYTAACPGGASDCSRAEGAWFITYNKKWQSVMAFPSGFFTATMLTDHPFHWGYIIDAAATIAQFDKAWAKQYGGMINLLIRDIYNYKYGSESSADPKLPHFRSFDPYTGLSSVLGMPYSLDNVNEEDSAEFMNLAQGIILWGLNTQGVSFDGDNTTSQALIDTGVYLYATEGQALNYYHFNQHKNSGVYPANWTNTSTGQTYLMIGNVWGGKSDRSTYFCAGQPCYYQNLASNTLPLTSGSFYLGYDASFVNDVYMKDAKNPCSGDVKNSAYCGTLIKYLALGDANKASDYFRNYFDAQANIPDPGESLPSIFYWIQSLKNLGNLNASVTANTPAYAAFGAGEKLYVAAYNASSQPKSVNFYQQGKTICNLSLAANETKGVYCQGGNPTDPTDPVTSFAYRVYLGWPFKPVLINNQYKCPDPVTGSPACLIEKVPAPSTMTIKGSEGNLCTIAIDAKGAMVVSEKQSKNCFINTQSPTPTVPANINLPSGF